ncbi:hypothetical protein [Calidithermus roseus]|uniref:Uncharacterized protein n=1 Tax=Calidithermus roseus TaxID=1644118 RepID=A0A399EIN9_9DEIN|nr:hypothetical protein [Calidithermus roseus]RIH83293.1 hypothetical protein Mrose_03093 [Calidithermus roseus]
MRRWISRLIALVGIGLIVGGAYAISLADGLRGASMAGGGLVLLIGAANAMASRLGE